MFDIVASYKGLYNNIIVQDHSSLYIDLLVKALPFEK